MNKNCNLLSHKKYCRYFYNNFLQSYKKGIYCQQSISDLFENSDKIIEGNFFGAICIIWLKCFKLIG